MASLTRVYNRKKLLGQVYTPPHIVDKILDETGMTSANFLGKKILDPACGDGRFLVSIVRRIITYSPPEKLAANLTQVNGWDIDAEALRQCRAALDEEVAPLGLKIQWNLQQIDALLQWNNRAARFDFIVGNPPYIRIQNLPEQQRQYLQTHYAFCGSGSTDTYVAFFELAHHLLTTQGVCGYITPNSYFFSETARPLRQYFQAKQNLHLITNFGTHRVFENAGTYAAITIFGKSSHPGFRYELSNDTFHYQTRTIPFQELRAYDLWQLGVSAPARTPGHFARLGDICKISVGITTLCDKVFLFTNPESISDTLVKVVSKPGEETILEKSILRPIIKASRLKPGQDILEYILFPYQQNGEGKNTILPEEVLKNDYPKTYEYLLSQKKRLNQRDNGRANPVSWYAFGRAQSLDSGFGEKIVFSPMNKRPNFILSLNPEATIYSGYFIKYPGNLAKLLPLLNSEAMAQYMEVAGRDFRGGWKGYSKKIVENFLIDTTLLEK